MTMRPVELRPAFVWTCEQCGRDHYTTPIIEDHENIDEVQQQVVEELGLPPEAVDFMRVPSQVRCQPCGIWYVALPQGVSPVDDDEPEWDDQNEYDEPEDE